MGSTGQSSGLVRHGPIPLRESSLVWGTGKISARIKERAKPVIRNNLDRVHHDERLFCTSLSLCALEPRYTVRHP